ncbi:MAG: ATP synthase F1 subunit delta [Patescibacteria group bacterium]|nr:ATP synthase F1 subunit delta [Patescibacteria group bacterium]
MKITIKQFALSLYETVDGKSPNQVKAVIKKFVEILAENNQLSKAEKITAEFIKIWNNKHGIVEARAVSAKVLEKPAVKLLKDYIVKLSGAKEVMLSREINKDILGGVVIRYGDRVVDGSLKTQLVDLKDKLIK